MGMRSSHPSTVQRALGVEHESLPGGGQCVLGWVCEPLAHWWAGCVWRPPSRGMACHRSAAQGTLQGVGLTQGPVRAACHQRTAWQAQHRTAWHDMAGMWHMPAVPADTRAGRLPPTCTLSCPAQPSPAPCMQCTPTTAYYSLLSCAVHETHSGRDTVHECHIMRHAVPHPPATFHQPYICTLPCNMHALHPPALPGFAEVAGLLQQVALRTRGKQREDGMCSHASVGETACLDGPGTSLVYVSR